MVSASRRLAKLFEERLGRAIARGQIEDIASQRDYMKRLRRNGGARDILDKEGIALLWGKGDRDLIAALRLGPVGEDEFISFRPKDRSEWAKLAAAGHGKVTPPLQ